MLVYACVQAQTFTLLLPFTFDLCLGIFAFEFNDIFNRFLIFFKSILNCPTTVILTFITSINISPTSVKRHFSSQISDLNDGFASYELTIAVTNKHT